MKSGRFFMILLALVCISCMPPANASAFWGFGGDKDESGLDFERGYDLNTVTTVKGKVVSVDAEQGRGPVTITIRQGTENIHAVAAPRWYWSDRGIAIKPNDEIEVSGAKAQGKDGNMYIISKEITNLSTGRSVTLRTENGRPTWSGGGRGGRGGGGGGMQRRFGGGMRGR